MVDLHTVTSNGNFGFIDSEFLLGFAPFKLFYLRLHKLGSIWS